MSTMTIPVQKEQWLAARLDLLAKEKEWTRMRDELNRQRQAMPRLLVDKEYIFDGPRGKETLADLFGKNDQLVVYHFMFAPDWAEGCVGCSLYSDHIEPARMHFEKLGISYAAVSRAPWSKIEPFQKRMGWKFHWVSSFANDFNFDYHVSFRPEEIATGQVYYNYGIQNARMEELPGSSVFQRDADGSIYHTYSVYARGLETSLGVYSVVDLTPNGRPEHGPAHNLMDWARHHDRYETSGESSCGCGAQHG